MDTKTHEKKIGCDALSENGPIGCWEAWPFWNSMAIVEEVYH